MKTFFKDLFEYHHIINQKLIKQLKEHEDKLSERTIPLLSHSINAHQIWNARILKQQELGVHQIHTLNECVQIDNENYQETLSIIDNRDLEERIAYTNSKGMEYSNSVKEILFHTANHFSHHRGQIISDLRKSGVAPIITDYIYHRR